MDIVKVDKGELLFILKENRVAHKATVTEAFISYRKLAIEELDKMIAEAKAGKKIRRALELIEPMDMTDAYDTAIMMLEMSVDTTVELDTHEFQQYVQDKWQWSNQFSVSNMMYTQHQN